MTARNPNGRFVFATGLHTEGMTVEESERLFEEQAFRDVASAKQQSFRRTYDTAHLNYIVDKLMIVGLREDWTGDRGGREAWKAFYDEYLAHGVHQCRLSGR